MRTSGKYSGFCFGRAGAACGLVVGLAGVVSACHEPDPRSVAGALDAAMRAVEARDAQRLFRLVDQRARHAMESIVQDRREAARLIAADYPADERAAARVLLGDAAAAGTSAELFAARCGEPCLSELGRRIGAPAGTEETGAEVLVHTARGESLRLYHGSDGWWGLVWNTDALIQERNRAAQDLRQIQTNAEVYRRRRGLEQAAP